MPDLITDVKDERLNTPTLEELETVSFARCLLLEDSLRAALENNEWLRKELHTATVSLERKHKRAEVAETIVSRIEVEGIKDTLKVALPMDVDDICLSEIARAVCAYLKGVK